MTTHGYMHIISEITPLYNQYKQEKTPVLMVQIMWKIGKVLDFHVKETKLKPHNLFRELYGKSEGTTNKAQKSYIPREFQGRCYRVYKMFKSEEDIINNLKNLISISAFREAMPFFDNPKYQLKGEQFTDFIKLITSLNKSSAEVMNIIKEMQQKIIGIKNPRTQRLDDLVNEKEIFIDFYKYILELIKLKDYNKAINSFFNNNQLNIKYIRSLALSTEQLVLSNVTHEAIIPLDSINEITKQYSDMLERLLQHNNDKIIRRFKRVVPTIHIMTLTDMLHSLTNEESYYDLTKKLK